MRTLQKFAVQEWVELYFAEYPSCRNVMGRILTAAKAKLQRDGFQLEIDAAVIAAKGHSVRTSDATR